jgi:type I restriction enzyme S subunit
METERQNNVRHVPANEFCSSIFDGTHDSPKRQPSGRKLVTGKQLKNNEILLDDAYFISEEDYKNIIVRSGVQVSDVLFTTIGTVGEVCRVITPADYAIKNIGVFRPKHREDSAWLYYYFLSPQGKTNVESLKRGSTQQFLGLKELRDFPIPTPGDQNFRSGDPSILESLASKISNNRKIATSLETIVSSIFRSWFVDFDPVQAKRNGEKPPGISEETAALFPNNFVESAVGPIPFGWQLKPVGDVLEVAGGATPSTSNSDYWGGEIIWTTPKDLSTNKGLITTGSARTLTEEGLIKISSGVLPVHSVIMSCRAPIGYLSINAVPTAVNQGCITLRNSEFFSPLYLVNWVLSNMQEIKNRAGGATFAEISRKAFKEIPFIIPTTEILNAFSELASPIVEQLESLTRENEALAAIINLLLPRLISGEIEIPEEMLAL